MTFPILNNLLSRGLGASLCLCGILWLCSSSSEGAEQTADATETVRRELSSSSPAEVLLFSPNDHLGELFLPLHEEGKVGSLTLVVPSEASFSDLTLSSWKSYVSGISPGSENGFILRDGALEGKIRGLKVRVLPVSDWKNGPGKGPVFLDLAFLPAIYRDDVRTPFVELPRKFLATLDDRKVDIARLRAWIADRDDIPLERGYLPRLVAAMIRDPVAFRAGLPPKWESLRRAEHLFYLAMYEQAVSQYEMYLKEEKEEPSALYRIATMHLIDREPERGLRFLHRAFRADPYYIRGYSASAFMLFGNGDLDSAERVIRAGLHQEPESADLKVGLGRVLLAQARKIYPADADAAEKRFAETASVGLPEESLKKLRGEWEESKAASSPGSPSPGMPRGHSMGH